MNDPLRTAREAEHEERVFLYGDPGEEHASSLPRFIRSPEDPQRPVGAGANVRDLHEVPIAEAPHRRAVGRGGRPRGREESDREVEDGGAFIEASTFRGDRVRPT